MLSGVLEAIPYIGALLGVGQTIAGNEPDLIKALDSLAYAAAPFTFGITAALPMVAEVTGLKDLIRDVPHEVREARELSRYGVGASGLVKNILASQDFPSLYSTLLEHQTGYVGGTSPQAVDIGFPGRDYLGLYQQAQPWSTEDFFQAVRERPEELRANVQAGVNPSMLDPLNIGIARAVRSKVSELDALGRITQQLPAIQQQTQLADVNARDVLDAAIQAQSRGIAASSPEFIELLRSGYTTRQAQETAAREQQAATDARSAAEVAAQAAGYASVAQQQAYEAYRSSTAEGQAQAAGYSAPIDWQTPSFAAPAETGF